jgi:hypothetical protein
LEVNEYAVKTDTLAVTRNASSAVVGFPEAFESRCSTMAHPSDRRHPQTFT